MGIFEVIFGRYLHRNVAVDAGRADGCSNSVLVPRACRLALTLAATGGMVSQVMGLLMKEHKAEMDGKLAQRLVTARLKASAA